MTRRDWGEVFKGLVQEALLCAPFAVVADEADSSAVPEGALQTLVSNGHPEPGTGRYELTSAGRALHRQADAVS
jgi:hypothetical protein